MQPNRDGGAGLSGKKENHREHGGHGEKQTTEGTEDTEKKKHNAREPQLNGDGGWGLAGNSLAWRHENLRAGKRICGLAVQTAGKARRPGVLPEQFEHHDPAGGGYVQGVLPAEHRDLDEDIAALFELGPDAVHFMAEDQAHGKGRLPVEQIDGVGRGFHCGDLVSLGAQAVHHGKRIPGVFPGDGFFRAQGGFGDAALGRVGRDPAEAEALDGSGVGGAEEGAHVVHAADVVQ